MKPLYSLKIKLTIIRNYCKLLNCKLDKKFVHEERCSVHSESSY